MSEIVAIDPQIAGIVEDGNAAGASRAKLVRGNLVPIPFRQGQYGTDLGSTATAAFQEAALIENSDGTNSGINVVVPSDAAFAGRGARVRFAFYGRVFGLRFRRDATTPAMFSVGIDGVFYPVVGNHTFLSAEGLVLIDNEANVLIAEDLTEGVHYADVTLVADAAVSQTLVLYGYLVEDRAGYRQPNRYLNFALTSPAVVPNTATAINKGGSAGISSLRAVRKLIYTNITAGPITVTLKLSGVVWWSKAIAANDTQEVDLGGLCAISSVYTHEASAASSVNYTAIGGN